MTLADPVRPVSIGVPAPTDFFSNLLRARRDVITNQFIKSINEGTTYPPLALGTYTPNENDSYEKIAQMHHGDSRYGSVLETADGQPGALAAPVRLPPIVPMYNKADSYIPQDQLLANLAMAFYPVMDNPDLDDISPVNESLVRPVTF